MKHRLFILFAAALLAASCISGEYRKFAESDFKWSIVLEQDQTPFTRTVLTPKDSDTPVVTKDGKNIVYAFNDVNGKDIDVSFTFAPYKNGKGVEVSSTVTNNEKGVYVKAVIGPIFEAQDVDLVSWDMFVPWGPGMRYSGRPDSVEGKNVGQWKLNGKGQYEITAAYPTGACHMQYIEFNDGKQGAMIIVQKQSGANSVAISDAVMAKLPELQAGLPSDVKLGIIVNTSSSAITPRSFFWNCMLLCPPNMILREHTK